MVKKFLKFLAYFFFFIFALIVFVPKESLYYLAEAQGKKFDVIVSNETLHEHTFWLGISNLELSAKEIQSAVIEEVDIKILLVYNSISVKNIQLSSLVDAYLPSKIDTLDIHYSIFSPLSIKAEGEGDFGEVKASFDILKRELQVVLKPTNRMLKTHKKSLGMFTKSKTGEYLYAKTF